MEVYVTKSGWSVMCLLFLSCLCFGNVLAQDEVSPSHVYQQAGRIIQEISLLRNARNVDDVVREPGVQVRKLPLHVYGKSLELLEKIARMQSDLGMEAVALGPVPLTEITPSDVFGLTVTVLQELRRIKRHLGVTNEIGEVEFVGGKTPSDVYENVWRASYSMDAIVGAISPGYVYRNTEYILDDLRQIKAGIGAASGFKAPDAEEGKTPKDVNIEGFKNLHRITRLERKLGMPAPLRVSAFPYGNIEPSDVYDTTNVILAELVRVKLHLGIRTEHSSRPVREDIKPADVLTRMQLIGANLEAMVELL